MIYAVISAGHYLLLRRNSTALLFLELAITKLIPDHCIKEVAEKIDRPLVDVVVGIFKGVDVDALLELVEAGLC